MSGDNKSPTTKQGLPRKSRRGGTLNVRVRLPTPEQKTLIDQLDPDQRLEALLAAVQRQQNDKPS